MRLQPPNADSDARVVCENLGRFFKECKNAPSSSYNTRLVKSSFHVFISSFGCLVVSLRCLFSLTMFSLFHSVSLFLLLAVSSADILPFINNKQYQNGDWGYYPAQRFISDPDIIGPVPNVLVEAQHGVSENAYITWAPTGPDMVKIGPQLLDAKTLAVVYQAPLLDEDNFGLSVQSFGGSDYLVFWSGFNIDGRSVGQYHIVCRSRRHNL